MCDQSTKNHSFGSIHKVNFTVYEKFVAWRMLFDFDVSQVKIGNNLNQLLCDVPLNPKSRNDTIVHRAHSACDFLRANNDVTMLCCPRCNYDDVEVKHKQTMTVAIIIMTVE